jgi:hypothetical protein
VARRSGILGLAVLMRWLLVVLLISVGALVYVAGALTRHVLRQRGARTNPDPVKDNEAAVELPESRNEQDWPAE